ncbi:hypothetical protein GWK47_051861 [Chionoecetes opilio]|uniref:Uncharacterized protein n=1 Tax=Chionoecetes opilio TaxID=41210 RepID=A0A8J4Y7N4_CHIOP|nr:hypothetical protein GWK47_051861 [Chionoecetes opilio]
MEHFEDPPKYAALPGGELRSPGKRSWTTSETLGVLSRTPANFPRQATGYPDRHSKGTVGRGIHGFAGHGGFLEYHCPLFDTKATTVGYTGGAKLLGQHLQEGVLPGLRHHILEVLVGAVWENLFWGRAKAGILGSSLQKGVWTDLPDTLQTPSSTKMVEKKKKECKEKLQEILRSRSLLG